jgi:polysaccharide export outer membrane protein
MLRFPLVITVLLSVIFLSSCVSHRRLVSYQGDFMDSQANPVVANYYGWEGKPLVNMDPENIPIGPPPKIRIQPNDVLSIKVHSSDVETAAPFNLTPVQEGGGYINVETMQMNGYLVDQQGGIDFPVLGKIVLEGMTISEAKEMVKEKLKVHLKDPVVNMRLLNFTVTVSGEVRSPGSFVIVNERISLPDALALAGDLTDYANRRNVLLVRENGVSRSLHRIDIQSIEFFNSEFYYLKQNDLIYVEPIRAKTGSVQDKSSKTLPVIGTAATLVAVVVALLRR